MALGYQVHLIESDSIFNEFKVVPIHATGVRNPFSHTKPSFHVSDALWPNAAYGITLIGADPFIVSARQALKQSVKVVANNRRIGTVHPSIGKHVAGSPIIQYLKFKQSKIVLKQVFERVPTAVDIQLALSGFG